MDHGRCIVSDAHVRSPLVVELNKVPDARPCGLQVFVRGLPVELLRLDDSVDPLGNAVVRGLVVLCHADPYAAALQLPDVGVAAVLHSPVRMVDELAEIAFPGLFDGLAESVKRILCLQRRREAPSYDLVRVGVGDEVQVAAVPACQLDVGDVAHPQQVGSCRPVASRQVLVLAVPVVRVRRASRPGPPEPQPLALEQCVEGVPPYHASREDVAGHEPYLARSYPRVLAAYAAGELHQGILLAATVRETVPLLVPGLSAMAKQLASGADGQAIPLA